MLMLPLYAVAVSGPQNGYKHASARGFIALLASVVAAAPFVLPVLAWIPHTSRDMALLPAEYEKWNLHAFRFVEFVVPYVFQGDPGRVVNPLYQLYAGNEWTANPWALSVYLGSYAVFLLQQAHFMRDQRGGCW